MAITFRQFLLFVENVEENFDEWLESIKSYAKPNEQELKKIELGDAQKMLIIKALKDAKKENQDYMKFLMGVMASKPAALSEDLDAALAILKNAFNNVNPDTGSPYLTKKEITRDGWFNVGKTALTDLNAKMTRPESKRQVELAKKRGGFFEGANLVYDKDGIKVYHIPPLGDKATEKELEERHKLYCSIGKDTKWCTAQPNGVPKYQYVDVRDHEHRQFMDTQDRSVIFLPQEIYNVLFDTELVNTVQAPGHIGRSYKIAPIMSVENYKHLTNEEKISYIENLIQTIIARTNAYNSGAQLFSILEQYLGDFEDTDPVMLAAKNKGVSPEQIRVILLSEMVQARKYDTILRNLNSEKVVEALPEALQFSNKNVSGEFLLANDRDAIFKMLVAILNYIQNNPTSKQTQKIDPAKVAEAAAGFYMRSDFEIFDLLAKIYSVVKVRNSSSEKSYVRRREILSSISDKNKIFIDPHFAEKVRHGPLADIIQDKNSRHLDAKILTHLVDNDMLPRDEYSEGRYNKIYSFIYKQDVPTAVERNANYIHKLGYDLLASAAKNGDSEIMKTLFDKLAPSAVEQFLIDANLHVEESDLKPEVKELINKEFSSRKLKHRAASQALLDFASANQSGLWGLLPVKKLPDEKINSMVDKMIADGNLFEDFSWVLSRISRAYKDRSEDFSDHRRFPIGNTADPYRKNLESFLDNGFVNILNKIWPVYKEAREKSNNEYGMRSNAEYAKGQIKTTLENLQTAYFLTVTDGVSHLSPEEYAEHKKQFENKNLIKGLKQLKNNLDEVPNVYDIERPPAKPSKYDYD